MSIGPAVIAVRLVRENSRRSSISRPIRLEFSRTFPMSLRSSSFISSPKSLARIAAKLSTARTGARRSWATE